MLITIFDTYLVISGGIHKILSFLEIRDLNLMIKSKKAKTSYYCFGFFFLNTQSR
jgi:hypothetical protein